MHTTVRAYIHKAAYLRNACMRGQVVKQWLAFGVDLEQKDEVSVLVLSRLRSGSGHDEAAVHTCENV